MPPKTRTHHYYLPTLATTFKQSSTEDGDLMQVCFFLVFHAVVGGTGIVTCDDEVYL